LLWFLGYPDRAVETIRIGTAIAHESGSKALLGQIHLFASYVYEGRRELDLMQDRAEAALVIAIELGNVTYGARSEIYLGWAHAMAGDLDGGIARMRHHLSQYRATGTEVYSDYFLALIATALGRLRRFDEALRAIEEALPFIERTGQRLCEAEVYRLKGELLLAQNASNAAQAEQSFRTAIDISRRQNAKSWELRNLQLVHRGLRYRRPEGRQGAARRTEGVAGSVYPGPSGHYASLSR
jgi:tetratricopeptide (TPR) repeat protein